jgi:aspartate/methionine/tyrosine aminotransferase
MTWNLGWGEPVCVRETLDEMYLAKPLKTSLKDMSYPAYEGQPALVDHIKKMLGYKYIIVTNGTTSSINIVLRALAKAESRCVVVTEKPHFPFYPNIIEKCGYIHKTGILTDNTISVQKLILADVPSNPWGKLYNVDNSHNNVIWDSVYANKVYLNTKIPFAVSHRVNVGSFSKMLGITGLRIGWIGTDNENDFKLFQAENLYETCGISIPSQDLVTDILNTVDIKRFYLKAQGRVNQNREEFLKLNSFFDGQEIPVNGMFYPVWVNNSAIKIIDRANVQFITLNTEGDSTLIRFNLAQNNKITQGAVKAIKTADRLKK